MKTRMYYSVTAHNTKSNKIKTHSFMLSEFDLIRQVVKESKRTIIELTECSEGRFKTIFAIQ